MLKIKRNEEFFLDEGEYPELREVFNELIREHDFSIYSYEEEGGELQINIHENFVKDLEDIIEDYDYEFNNSLEDLINLVKENSEIAVFYYKKG